MEKPIQKKRIQSHTPFSSYNNKEGGVGGTRVQEWLSRASAEINIVLGTRAPKGLRVCLFACLFVCCHTGKRAHLLEPLPNDSAACIRLQIGSGGDNVKNHLSHTDSVRLRWFLKLGPTSAALAGN